MGKRSGNQREGKRLLHLIHSKIVGVTWLSSGSFVILWSPKNLHEAVVTATSEIVVTDVQHIVQDRCRALSQHLWFHHTFVLIQYRANGGQHWHGIKPTSYVCRDKPEIYQWCHRSQWLAGYANSHNAFFKCSLSGYLVIASLHLVGPGCTQLEPRHIRQKRLNGLCVPLF